MSRYIQIGLTFAIAATFASVVAVGINVFVPHPDTQARNACNQPGPVTPIAKPGEAPSADEQAVMEKQQKESQACYERIDAQEKTFNQRVFALSVLFGAVGVAAGVLFFPAFLSAAASGMTFGGFLTILYGMIHGLIGGADKRLMFLAVLFAFAVLLFVAWKKGKGFLPNAQTSEHH